ncbi:MAG: YfhO family protein [Clostridia bacterium]|nr:YfhO family protein [Clostridia bacterium]
MNKRKSREILLYLLPPLITIAAILIIYSVKGQYPFGSGTMMDNDWGVADFPGFVRFWDVAHGKESVFFDWSTGLGLPKSATGYFLYPINYILLFFKRDFLYEAMNFYYIAQMAAISVTSYAFFRNVFKKLPIYYTYLFSLAFTFCGFNLQYYTNISWLSSIAVFPLVALAAYRLLKGKSFVFYVLILAYSLVISTYLSFFMLEGIVLIGTLYIFCFLAKEERKGAAFRLGMGTVSAFLISFWSVFGFLFSTLGSTRVQNDTSDGLLAKIIDILKTENVVNSYKVLMLLGMEIGIVSLALIVIKNRKEIKKSLFFLFGFILFALPIVFENIDLILNGGSYNFYAMRNGFLIAFFLLCSAAYYFSNFDTVDEKEKNKIITYLKPVFFVIAFYVVAPIYIVMTQTLATSTALSNNGKMMSLSKAYSNAWGFLVVLILLIISLIVKNKKIRTVFICLTMVFIIGVDSGRLVAARDNFSGVENSEKNITEEYILDCNSIIDKIECGDCFKRVSNPSVELLMNYPVIIDRTAISDWSHIVNSDFREMFYYLGYGMMFTSTSDAGSTAFGNALMLVNNTFSTLTLNSDLYEKKQEMPNGFTYYNNRYTLPFGVSFDKSVFDVTFNGNSFDYQNEIFARLNEEDNSLFTPIAYSSKSYKKYTGKQTSYYDKDFEFEKEMYKAEYKYHVNEKSVLYFCLDDGSDISVDKMIVEDCTIELNGKRLIIPNYCSTESDIYRSGNNNNLIELGTFENEDVTIELNSTHPEIDKPMVYAMSLEKLGELCDNYKSCVTQYSTGKKSMSIKAVGEEGKYLFIPVYNNGNWVCTVNGERTEVRNVLGSFMAVELKDGENDIYINYVPKTFYITVSFSAFAAALFALVMIIIRKKNIKAPDSLEKLFLWALTGLFSAFIAVAYIIPIIANIYYAFVGRE